MVEKRILHGPTYDLYHELDLIKSYIEKKESGYQFLKIHGDSPFEEKSPFDEEQYMQALFRVGIQLDLSTNIPGLSWESIM